MIRRPTTVVQFGLGAIGAALVRHVAALADFELVGAVDNDPRKVGQDVGRLVGSPGPLGIPVESDARATLQRTRPDVVLHATGSRLSQVDDQLELIVQSGASVVSTCEELVFPFATQPELAGRLDGAARASNVSIVGSGVNPGFVMDLLPVTLAMVCQSIEEIHVVRVVDTARRRVQLQSKTGVSLSPQAFVERAAAGLVGHVGLRESALLLARGLGWSLDEVTESLEPIVAERPARSAAFEIQPGQVAGLRQRVTGSVSGRERLVLDLRMELQAGDPRDEIRITGRPSIDLRIADGVSGDLATVAAVVSCARRIGAAPRGLISVLDLPVSPMTTDGLAAG